MMPLLNPQAVVLFQTLPTSAEIGRAAARSRRKTDKDPTFPFELVTVDPFTAWPFDDWTRLDPSLEPLDRGMISRLSCGLLLRGSEADGRVEYHAAWTGLILLLLQLGGAAVLFPESYRLVPARHIIARIDPEQPAQWRSILLNRHIVSDATRIWYHTHGLINWGLPDLEIWTEPETSGLGRRLIEGEIERLLNGGAPLPSGSIVEAFEGRQRVAFSMRPGTRQVPGHSFGSRGVVELALMAW